MSYTLNLMPTSPPSQKTSVEQKIKARNAALLLKNGSPKLRDLLREVIILNNILLYTYY